MCGFVGVLNGDIKKIADKQATESLCKSLIHRGPDDFGSFSDGPYAVSHQRLSIIDLSKNASQPMQNADKTISLVFNGEIYNFKELKAKYLLAQKFRFRSKTDTEVILYLYELLGIQFVNELNGMFAIAIWDSTKRQLFLIRDRFGIKPLFYTVFKNSIWFASEIKSLLKIPEFKRKVCFEAIHHYFSFDYIPGELTSFEGIKEIRPGFLLEAKTDSYIEIKKIQYWKPKYGDYKPKNVKTAIEDIRYLIKESVKSQLISDVPVGVMLSGGLDSSTITYMMSQIQNSSDFHTFSIGFDEKSFDESKYAEIVSKHTGTKHHKIKITPQSIIDNIEKYLLYIDEPYADGSAIPTYLLSQQAKKYVTVLLSGEGGDEIFAGYDTYRAYNISKFYKKVPCFAQKPIRAFVNHLPSSYAKLSFDFKAKKFVSGCQYNVPVSHYMWREVFSENDKKKLLDIYKNSNYMPSYKLFEDCFNDINTKDELNKLLYIDFSYYFANDLMINTDRMTMAHSIEARVPFTDIKLFDYLANLSGDIKLYHNNSKYLLKQAMEPFFPKQILKKKKIGLEIPYSKWFLNELKQLLLDNLSLSSLKKVPFINADYVQQIINEHFNHKADRGRELWGLLNFVIWYRLYFIDK
jgi:asparagine synthase (glutamine-hydrolysing)